MHYLSNLLQAQHNETEKADLLGQRLQHRFLCAFCHWIRRHFAWNDPLVEPFHLQCDQTFHRYHLLEDAANLLLLGVAQCKRHSGSLFPHVTLHSLLLCLRHFDILWET